MFHVVVPQLRVLSDSDIGLDHRMALLYAEQRKHTQRITRLLHQFGGERIMQRSTAT